MAVTYNMKGTSHPNFAIGKSGPKIFTDSSDPSGSYTVANSDLWIDTTDFQLKIRSGGAWKQVGETVETLSASNITISGDLTISGTTTSINSTTLDVHDNKITLNTDWTAAPTQDAGIVINRGSADDVELRWNETSDIWEFTTDGTAYTQIGNTQSSGLTANEFVVVNATGNGITSDSTLNIDTNNNYLGINQSSPEVTLHMTGEGAQTAQIRMEQHNDTADAPDVRTRKSRGTAASPTSNNAGDFIYRSNHERYNGSSWTTVGQLAVDANGSNANRFQLSLAVSEDGSSIDAADAQFKIDGNDSGAITFNDAYKFPTSDGTANQVLQTDGSGALTFATISTSAIDNVVEDTTPQLGGDLDLNSNNITGTGNINTTGSITLTDTDAGSAASPSINLYRNSASPSGADYLGEIDFQGESSTGANRSYAQIKGKIADPTNGTEDGTLEFWIRNNGSNNVTARMNENGILLTDGMTLKYEGATNDSNETTLTVEDPTADRTITLPDATGTVSLLDNTETLSNKTMTAPVLNAPVFGTGTNSPYFTEVRYNTSNMMKFNQMYSGAATGSYFDPNEYQKVVTITPDGSAENYQVSGRIMAQNANDIHVIHFNAALRSNTLPNLDWTIDYTEEYNGTRYIDPQLWTKESTTAGFIFAFKILSRIYGTVTVDMDVIPRTSSLLSNVVVNSTQNSEQSSVDSGFTANDMTKIRSSRAGRFGIGTSPYTDAHFHIKNDDVGLEFSLDGAVSNEARILSYDRDANTRRGLVLDADHLDLRTGGNTRLLIGSSGALTFNGAYSMPTADGSSGSVLQTNGSGAVSFSSPSRFHSSIQTVSSSQATTNATNSVNYTFSNLNGAVHYNIYLNRMLLRPSEFSVSGSTLTINSGVLATDDELEVTGFNI